MGVAHTLHTTISGSFASVQESQTHHPGGAAAMAAATFTVARVVRAGGAEEEGGAEGAEEPRERAREVIAEPTGL